MSVWLIKPEGLYDTFEADDVDISEFFEEEEWEATLGTYQGWSFRPAR